MTKHKPVYTAEKARHLVTVYMSVTTAVALIGWLEIFIVNPLKTDAKEMAHMDPSEIAALPSDIRRLTIFTGLPVVFIMLLWLRNAANRLTSNLLSLAKLTLVIYATFGVAGNNIVENYRHSLTAALYVASLASTTWTGVETTNVLKELPFADSSDLVAFCRLYGMLLTTIPFSVVTILDAGMQLQRWPLPVICGCTYGYTIGTLIGVTALYYRRKAKEDKQT